MPLLQDYKVLYEQGIKIDHIICNGQIVWPAKQIDYTEPFYVENIGNSAETISVKKRNTSAPTVDVYYSRDKVNWTRLGNTSTTAKTISLSVGDKVYLRANTTAWGNANGQDTITGMSKIGGNAMSLLYGSNFTGTEKTFPTGSEHTFRNLFRDVTTLIDAKDLLLPATTLTLSCYQTLFRGCTALKNSPKLCALNLAQSCYQSFFQGCTALSVVPDLPATIMANSCYQSMFYECSNIKAAPILSAITLDEKCYYQMFQGCSSLNYVKCTATNISATQCTYNWLTNVSSTGTFVKAGGVTWSSGTSGIPSGWTVIEA